MKSAEQMIAEGDDEHLPEHPEAESEGEEIEGEEASASEGEEEEGDEPQEEEEPAPAPAARGRARARSREAPPKREPEPNFARESSREADHDVRSWINSLGIKTPLRIELVRKAPKRYKGQNIEGTIESFDEPIDEEDIRDMHGGGTYVLRIKAPDDKGRYVYKTQRQIKISGPPRISHLGTGEEEEGKRQSDPVTDRMMRLIEDQIAEGKKGGADTYAMIQAIAGPMKEQNESLRQELREIRASSEKKDAQILELMTKKPDTSHQDRLLELTVTSKEGDLRELRSRYDDEIRKLRDDHRQELQRERERHADDLKEVRRDAQRQIEMAKSFADQNSQVSKTSYDGQIASLNRTISEKDEVIRELRAEIKELREKKERGPLDQMQDLARLKESFDDFGLGGGDENKSGVLDRLLAGAEPIIGRILESQRPPQGGQPGAPAALPPAGAGGQPAQASAGAVQIPEGTPPEQLPPEGVPIKLPDGSRYVRQGMELHPYDPADVRRRRAAAAASGKRPARAAANVQSRRNIDPADVQKAAAYIEQALENGHNAATVANSVRGVVGGDILDHIREHGIDDLLKVARLDHGSPLKTQHGKEFIREIARILVE